jgi:histidinol-phosphate aminotransferase
VLVAELATLGFQVLPSSANFVFAKHASLPGKAVYSRLREKGILVRYFSGALLSPGVRITVGTPDENRALVHALRAILAA